jgi:hypothetical protein
MSRLGPRFFGRMRELRRPESSLDTGNAGRHPFGDRSGLTRSTRGIGSQTRTCQGVELTTRLAVRCELQATARAALTSQRGTSQSKLSPTAR